MTSDNHYGGGGAFATAAWGSYPAGVCVSLSGPQGGARGAVLLDPAAALRLADELRAAAAKLEEEAQPL